MNLYERLNQERKLVDMKKRVAAYCRVSTDNEDQANSFESQQRYFRQYIDRNPHWELYEIFAEMKISKMIQFENTNPPRKRRNKGFRHIRCCRESLFFVPWNDCV